MSKYSSNLAKLFFLLVLLNGLLFWARHYVKQQTDHLQGYRMFLLMPYSLYGQHKEGIENVLTDQKGKPYSIKQGPEGTLLLAFPSFSLYANSLTSLSSEIEAYYSFNDYLHKVYGKAILIVSLLMIAAISLVFIYQPRLMRGEPETIKSI